MLDKLKALGLALIVVLAIGAVVASGASAANDVFTSEAEPTDLTGTTETGSKPVFGLGGGTEIACEDTSYTGTMKEKKVTEITLHYVFNGPCKIGTTSVTGIDTDGCDYVFTGTTDTVGTETHATMSEECTTGKEVLFTTGAGITIHFAAQGPLLGVTYSNIEDNTKDAITINMTIKGTTYTCTGAFCGILPNKGNGNNGVYTDKVIVTGYEDKGTFTQNATTHVWSGTHGQQVGLTWSEGT